MELSLDLRTTPFSRYGNYLMIQHRKTDTPLGEGLYLRHCHGQFLCEPNLFRIELLVGGEVVQPEIQAQPTRLVLSDGAQAGVTLCFDQGDTLLIRGERAGLRLQMPVNPNTVAFRMGEKLIEVNARQSWHKYMIETMQGRDELDAPWRPDQVERCTVTLMPDDKGRLQAAIDEFYDTWIPRQRPRFDAALRDVEAEWKDWLQSMPQAPEAFVRTHRLAAYIDWSSVVRPQGHFYRPAMLMSKVQMRQVWSWDNCFNAMAMAYHRPELAWDQLLVMADQQDDLGAFPDACNDMHYHHNFVKPPVHGWALRFVLARSGKVFERRLLEDMYEVMSRWASWWLDHRRYKDQALPYYLHGNDSGWDNSTMFDEGVPLVAPDLAAFLAEHCETLSVVAATLRRKRESAHWHAQSQELVTALMRELWREDHFIARRALDGHEVHCDSLITCMPLLLGKRLPEHVRNALIKRLQRHLTEWGLATEPPDSPHYDSDGYWRGPIWAPSTMLLVDALARCEQTEMARDISRRFCRLCAKSDFAENFDALSGEARRDTAYTWTASVFLVLAQEYLMGDGEPQD